jgi:hypothetical protein
MILLFLNQQKNLKKKKKKKNTNLQHNLGIKNLDRRQPPLILTDLPFFFLFLPPPPIMACIAPQDLQN